MAQPPRRRVFQVVVAVTRSWGIGKDGTLPWKLPGDLAFFRALTQRTDDPEKRNAVVMGRRTWESIPERFRPLPGRLNVVLTRGAAGAGAGAGAGATSAGSDENAAPPAASAQQPPLGPSGRAANAAAADKAAAKPAQAASAAAAGDNVVFAPSLEAALARLEPGTALGATVERVFVVGGGQVYAEALASPRCAALHVTHVDADPECDAFFPPVGPDAAAVDGGAAEGSNSSSGGAAWRVWSAAAPRRDGDTRYSFVCYVRAPAAAGGNGDSSGGGGGGSSSDEAAAAAAQAGGEGEPPLEELQLPPGMASRHDEMQYLDLVSELIREGTPRGDRTGTGTLSKFGAQMRFNLRHGLFPLLTTKRVFWRGVVEELLWFVRGCTDAHALRDRGVHIWDGNSSRAFLDGRGLTHYEEGDLGPVYGFQWRHFGARYAGRHADYTGQGVDQLAQVVRAIKETPEDRRIILTAWNPCALPEMALPPCHMMAQFYVADGELSCQLYQRSADVGLGVPFNIASYALLTRMLAQVTGLKPGDFVHTLGDAHVYANHVEPLKVQLLNAPRPFPRLELNAAVTDVDAFTPDDFTLVDYAPHRAIKMAMAV